MSKIKAVLERPAVEMNAADKELHDALLLKLAGTVLPRLTEVTGEDGAPVVIQVSKEIADKNRIHGTDAGAGPDSEG